MKRAPCAEFGERRSAFVDGALNQTDRDRLLSHLAGCASCRQDIEDLRAVRDLVARARQTPGTAPADLSQRLVSIAGSDFDEPLWSRPFRRTHGGALPSTRASRIRATVAGMAVGAAVAVVSVIGYFAAPADLAAISDPSPEAEAEFSSAVGRSPLSSDALSALLVANSTGSTNVAAAVAGPGSGPTVASGGPVSAAEARTSLERAAAAAQSISYSGVQIFLVQGSGRRFTARLGVLNQAGQGSQVTVISQSGEPSPSGFSPASASTRMVDTGLLSLLERNYLLSGVRGSSVAGRPATLLQATRNGVVARQWWVDDASGIVLWQDSYDSDGVLQDSVGFTAIALSDGGELIRHLPPRLTVGTTNTTLTLSNAGSLRAAGWFGDEDLAGLSLVRLRVDRSSDPSAVQLLYSDGLNTVSVYQQRGKLEADPQLFGWDPSLGAFVQQGATNLAAWQSGDRVFTVMTDSSASQLARAVASMPHAAARERTTIERIQAGWGHILADVKG